MFPTTSPDTPVAADIEAVISALMIYPIKSCAGVVVQESLLIETGLELDRAWMVVDEKGEFLTQRECPRMALVQPQLRHYEMVLRAPGMLALHVKLEEVEAPVRVRLWGDEVAAFDMGAIAAQWFSDFLGQVVRLVRFDPEHKRLCSQKWTDGVAAQMQFADGYSVLVISEASLAYFNEKMVGRGHEPVSMARFRPNLVLRTVPVNELAAHDEDRIDTLYIATDAGEAQLKLVKPCPRCPIPNVDPLTAEVSPLVGDLLQTYRHNARLNGAVTFGMNAIVLSGVETLLKVGQRVRGNFRFD